MKTSAVLEKDKLEASQPSKYYVRLVVEQVSLLDYSVQVIDQIELLKHWNGNVAIERFNGLKQLLKEEKCPSCGKWSYAKYGEHRICLACGHQKLKLKTGETKEM